MGNSVIKTTTIDGRPIEYVDKMSAQGGMKDIYFSPQKDYVVAFFRGKPDISLIDRLVMITDTYRKRIFEQDGGEYWKQVFRWPENVVNEGNRVGVVVPFYQPNFFSVSVQRTVICSRSREKKRKANGSRRQITAAGFLIR